MTLVWKTLLVSQTQKIRTTSWCKLYKDKLFIILLKVLVIWVVAVSCAVYKYMSVIDMNHCT